MNAQLRIDGNAMPFPEQIPHLEGLLAYIMERDASRKVITEVKIDGLMFSEAYTHHARHVELGGVSSVDVTTQNRESFARSFMAQLPDLQKALQSGFRSAIELLRSESRNEDGQDMLLRSLETFQTLYHHLNNVMIVLGNADGIDAMERMQRRFCSVSEEIISSQKRCDALEMAAVLESTVLPILSDWQLEMSGI